MADQVLVDSHVHVHGGTDVWQLLAVAAENFRRGASGWNIAAIFIAEIPGGRRFDEFRPLANHGRASSGWTLDVTDEEQSLIARSEGGHQVALIRARQIVTSERLEVIALGVTADLRDGDSLPTTLASVRRSGALPVIPWGFGKWTGIRGRLVKKALAKARTGDFLLGDNGNRPIGHPAPRLFGYADNRGIPVVAGSDPLPLRSQRQRAGMFGSILQVQTYDERRPAAAIERCLRRLSSTPPSFGRRTDPASFLVDQLRIRFGATEMIAG